MDEILSGLNEAQREAVTATEGFVRVIAGAGSGKTRALTRRFAYLVCGMGILPGNILCVTFTNKAANEMRRRIHLLTGDNDTGYINTFHGFCVTVLQEDSHAVSYPRSFLVLDNSDIDSMLRTIYDERGLSLRDMSFSAARDMIEILKLKKIPDYCLDLISMSADELKEKYERATDARDVIFYGYLWQEKKCFALDYNDLIVFTLHIFEHNADIRLKWQKRLEYIMIDEFQDIDEPQYRLMKALCGYHGNLFVVGDPDQTIYTWRGANVRYLLELDREFPGMRTVMMTRNYRSTPQILAAANALIDKNAGRIKKELIPTLPDGESVLCRYADNSEAEAEWMLAQIGALRARGVPLKDIAVLYRAHYVTRSIEEVFLKARLPYAIYSGVQFFDRMEVKDALSYLRMLVYRDDLSFMRVANSPKRNLGRRRTEFLRDYAEANACSLYEALRRTREDEMFRGTKAAQFITLIEYYSAIADSMPVSELLSAILNESGYETMLRTEGSQERLDNLAELKQSIYEYETGCGEECTLEHYLKHVALFTNADAAEAPDKVKLMTVHSAKGLEFPYVFLCGMNEGVFPSRKTATLQAMEEERRLAFVAVTRAEKRLYLSEAAGRSFDGAPKYPSRFLLDIGDEHIEYDAPPKADLIEAARGYIEHSLRFMPQSERPAAFAPGDRLRHPILGPGVVESVDAERGAYVIRFDGMETARTISFRTKLEKE